MPSATTQYWSGAQKLRFVAGGTIGTHVCVNNPTKLPFTPLTKAQASVPIQPGSNTLVGGVEFAASAIPLEWPEMDLAEYQQISAFFYVPCVMIDMSDNGYNGWLIPVAFELEPGVQTKVGKATMKFVVSKPANGLSSVINTLTAPTLSLSQGTGGSIPNATTLYFAATAWSNWGESTVGPTSSITTTAANSLINISWTAPTSQWYRKLRIYISTSSNLLSGNTSLVKAEIFSALNQTFIDYCGTNGVTSTASIPSINQAYTGKYAGGLWINLT